MGFSEHKITAFANRVSDLADQPNLPPQELKARFDACPEELRVAVNGMCDEGDALSARIDAYRAQTFEGEITRDMLKPEVQEELSGKADKTELTAAQDTLNTAVDAEKNARTSADSNLQTQIIAKCRVITGAYTGDGEASRFINLGATPKAVLLIRNDGETVHSGGADYFYGGLAVTGHPCQNYRGAIFEIVANGFQIYYNKTYYVCTNALNVDYRYAAFV